MLTKDQQYAIMANERVLRVQGKGQAEANSYGAMSHKLPVLIRTAGLAQALTFVDARGTAIHRQLLDDLAETIGIKDRGALLTRAREAPINEYMLLTRRVLAALLWYKRFAQSILDVDTAESSEEVI